MTMSGLSKNDVLHVAKLAKLQITPAEEKKFQKQLSEVVDYIGELNEVNTEGVEATSQTTGLTDVLRNDKVTPGEVLSQEEVLSGTEEAYNGYFKVAALLKERGEK